MWSNFAFVLQDLNEAKDGQWTRYVFNQVTLRCLRLAVSQQPAPSALLGLLQTDSCEAHSCLVKPHLTEFFRASMPFDIA